MLEITYCPPIFIFPFFLSDKSFRWSQDKPGKSYLSKLLWHLGVVIWLPLNNKCGSRCEDNTCSQKPFGSSAQYFMFPSPCYGSQWNFGLHFCMKIIPARIPTNNLTEVNIKHEPSGLLDTQFSSIQFSRLVVSDSATPWIAARQASLFLTNSQSLPRLMSNESMMPSSHLILCRPLLLLPSTPPSIRVFSSESTLRRRRPKYWSFSFNISPSNEHPGLISFRMDR